MINANLAGEEVEFREAEPLLKPASWLETSKQVKQAIGKQKNKVVLILAEQGAGKTTFAHFLYKFLYKDIKSFFITATPLLTTQRLFQEIARVSKQDSEDQLADWIDSINQEKQPTLLLIDNAHYLPEDLLQSLFAKIQALGKKNYFHLCLLSNHSLSQNARNSQFSGYADWIHEISLGQLSQDETRTYLRQKQPELMQQISEEQLRQFYQLTEGDIAGINSQMRSFFSEKNQVKPKRSKTLSYAISAFCLGTAAGIGVYCSPLAEYFMSEQSKVDPSTLTLVEEYHDPLPEEETAAHSFIPHYHWQAEVVAIYPEENMRLAEGIEPSGIAPKAKIASVLQSAPTLKHKINRAVAVSQPKAQYAIQLMAGRNKADLLRFAAKQKLQGKYSIYAMQREHKPWYLLTYGTYKGLEQAKIERAALPKALAELKPWVRKLSGLKAIG